MSFNTNENFLTIADSVDLVTEFLRRGGDPLKKSRSGVTLLHFTNEPDVAKLLIEANPNIVFARDKSGRSVISTQRNIKILKMIFEAVPKDQHAALFEPDRFGSTALFHSQCDECFVFLVESAKEAEIDIVNMVNCKKQNALFRRLSPKITAFLINEGINTKQEDIKGRTPLFFANAHLTKWILDMDSSCVNKRDNSGNTALFYACTPTVAKILIRYGASTKIVNNYNETLEHNFRDNKEMLGIILPAKN